MATRGSWLTWWSDSSCLEKIQWWTHFTFHTCHRVGHAGLPIHFPPGAAAHCCGQWVESSGSKVFAAHRESDHPLWGDHQSRGSPREVRSVCFIHLLESTGHGMYFTYSHLYTERKDVLRVFSVKQKKMWAAILPVAQERRWAGGLSCSKYSTGHLLENELRRTNIYSKNYCKRHVILFCIYCALRANPQEAAYPASPGLWASYKLPLYCVKSECFPVELMRNWFSGVHSIDLRNQLINFCNHN